MENRARLAISVVRAVRKAVKPDFIVAVKLNSSDFQKGGFDHNESVKVAVMLEAEGVDFIEISGGTFETPTAYQHTSKSQSTAAREGYFLEYASAIKSALNIPLMVTGGFRSKSVMDDAIEGQKTDLIGIGRPFITQPNFPEKMLSGELEVAPTIERDFPPSETIPRGAVLNWFCSQLALLGEKGEADVELSLLDGHERYLEKIEIVTKRLLDARIQKQT